MHPEPAQLIEARAGVGAKPDQLAFSIGFAITRSLLRRLLSEHAPDDARQELTQRVVAELELSFEIDEGEQVLRKAPADALAQLAPSAT